MSRGETRKIWESLKFPPYSLDIFRRFSFTVFAEFDMDFLFIYIFHIWVDCFLDIFLSEFAARAFQIYFSHSSSFSFFIFRLAILVYFFLCLEEWCLLPVKELLQHLHFNPPGPTLSNNFSLNLSMLFFQSDWDDIFPSFFSDDSFISITRNRCKIITDMFIFFFGDFVFGEFFSDTFSHHEFRKYAIVIKINKSFKRGHFIPFDRVRLKYSKWSQHIQGWSSYVLVTNVLLLCLEIFVWTLWEIYFGNCLVICFRYILGDCQGVKRDILMHITVSGNICLNKVSEHFCQYFL